MSSSSRPSRDEMLMEMAKVAASRSTCSRAQVGVVIAHEGRVLSTGYNGAPAGMAHCDHMCDCGWKEVKLDGIKLADAHAAGCARFQPCLISVHAEANAIAYAARHGTRLQWSTLYTTWSPCNACAQLIINAGIKEVVYGQNYRDPSGLELLRNAAVSLIDFSVIESPR